MPGRLQVSEKEAIERGWVQPPPAPPSPRRYRLSRFMLGALWAVAGWLVGFVCGLVI